MINRWGNSGNSDKFYFGSSKITADDDWSREIRCLLLERKAMTNLGSILKSRDITFPTKVHLIKAMVFPVVIYGCESWTIKKAEQQRINTFESWCWKRLFRGTRIFCKEFKAVNPKRTQSWIFIRGTDAEPEAWVFWPLDEQSWLAGKNPDAGKDWRQEKNGVTEDQRVGWHHWLNEHEFEQVSGDGEGQGDLACCSPQGHKELDMTEWLNDSNKL